MKAVSDERGVIAAAAMDQRGSLQKALAKERGGSVGDQEMEEFKILVTEVLTQHASAILLDPEWGIPASKRRAKDSGPADGLREDRLRRGDARTAAGSARPVVGAPASRKPAPTASRSCSTTRRPIRRRSTTTSTPGSSASATSAAPTTSRSSSRSSPTRKGVDEKGLEFAKKKPELVAAYMREFTKDRYGVDVLKVEVPINMKFVEGTKSFGGTSAYTKQQAMDAFRKTAEVVDQAVHLPVGRRQQRRVHRDAGAGRRGRHPLLGRALRPRDVEGRHPDLREAGSGRVPQVARDRRREEHRQRQRAPEGRRTRGSSSTARRAPTNSLAVSSSTVTRSQSHSHSS